MVRKVNHPKMSMKLLMMSKDENYLSTWSERPDKKRCNSFVSDKSTNIALPVNASKRLDGRPSTSNG